MAGVWKEATLDDIAQFRNGKAISPDRYLPTGKHPVFGSNGQIARTDDVLNSVPVIVIGRVGAYCGSVYYISETSWVTDNAIVATPKLRNDLRFLFYLLGSLELRRTAIGSAQPLMTQGGLKIVRTKVPVLAEQKAIAGVLGALDDKIESNRRTSQALERVARAIFRAWFVDFEPVKAKAAGARSFPGMPQEAFDYLPTRLVASELGPVPEGWEVKTADEVSDVGIGKTPPRMEHHWFSKDPSDIRWISIRDLGLGGVFISRTSEFLTAEAVEKFRIRRIPDDTVVLSFKLTMGRVAITDGEMLSNEAIAHFRLKPETAFGSAYLYCCLKGFDYDQLGSTSSIATAINSDIVRGIRILVPPEPIVEASELTLRPLFSLMKTLQRESGKLTTLREYLLPKLLGGEVRVAGAENPAISRKEVS